MLEEVQRVQIMIQGGALGMIGYLIYWVTMKKVPDDRKERAEERAAQLAALEAQTQHREQVAKAYSELAQKQRDDYLKSMREIQEDYAREADECRKERREKDKDARAVREADRMARHELSTMFQKALAELHSAIASLPSSPNRPAPRNDDRRTD